MFVLDTNLLSAMMSNTSPDVRAWMSGQATRLLFTTAVSEAEILSGVAVLPEGRRRSGLQAAARAMFLQDFGGRVLPFDQVAASEYADMFAARRRAGRPPSLIS